MHVLAPDDIPRALLSEHAEVLPEPLRGTIGRPLAHNQAVSALERYSLVTVTQNSLSVHRLVQTVVRASLSVEDEQQWAGAAARLINEAFPRGSYEVATWPACTLLLPHALAVVEHAEALDVEAETAARLCLEVGVYLWSRGQYQQLLALEERAVATLRRVLGNDHPNTLTSMNNLAGSLRALGDLDRARNLSEQAVGGLQRVLGDDHPSTFAAMNNLAAIRRELEEL